VVFLLLVAASSYPYVYVSHDKIETFFFVPMFLLLNAVMLYSVLKTRFAIKSMPNLVPDENLVAVHVLLFTVVTTLWIVDRAFYSKVIKAATTFFKDQNDYNYLIFVLASADSILTNLGETIANFLLNLFMLYMLHRFSVFKGFVVDPITKVKVPVLSMFQTAKVMEQSMKDRVLSDKQRAQIKRLMDYEEAQDMFRASEATASITGTFVANDFRDTLMSLRQTYANVVAVCSDSDSAGNEDDLEGEALQFALKGEPLLGSLGDENY